MELWSGTTRALIPSASGNKHSQLLFLAAGNLDDGHFPDEKVKAVVVSDLPHTTWPETGEASESWGLSLLLERCPPCKTPSLGPVGCLHVEQQGLLGEPWSVRGQSPASPTWGLERGEVECQSEATLLQAWPYPSI